MNNRSTLFTWFFASFRSTLSEEEQKLLKDWCYGLMAPDQNDNFPQLAFKTKLTDSEVLSPLLKLGINKWMALDWTVLKGK